MEITNFADQEVSRSNRFVAKDMVAQILQTPEDLDSNKYGVYIPRLMMGVDITEGAKEEVIDCKSTKCANSQVKTLYDGKIQLANYVQIPVMTVPNISTPILLKGEEVIVDSVDMDIKNLSIKPYSIDQAFKRPTDVQMMYTMATGDIVKPQVPGAGFDKPKADNAYWYRLDSTAKKINIHMSDSNGEKAQYDISIDGEAGIITLTDGKREMTLGTEDDTIYFENEAGTIVSLLDATIDMKCEQFYLTATESMEITSPDATLTLDNITQTTEELTAQVDKVTIFGDSVDFDYPKIDGVSDKIKVVCPVTVFDGLVHITDWCNPGGVGFGAVEGQAPLPTIPQISPEGMANFTGPAGLPLVMGMPLTTLLTNIALQLDIMATVPCVPGKPIHAPVFSPLISANASGLITANVKG